jgi:P-type Ca2+ transporter type 2C
VQDLTLLAMVGIVDPPRAEARDSIATAKSAGIQVRMITGDHAVTAAAIGRELGIVGNALTGAQFSALSDDELLEQLPSLGRRSRGAGGQSAWCSYCSSRVTSSAMTGDGGDEHTGQP